MAETLAVPTGFFAAGRPYARLESSAAHFRSLRKTRDTQRAKAIAFTEQVWELTYALEKRIQLPVVDLPGFSAGEVNAEEMPSDPAAAAQELRVRWSLGTTCIQQLVRTMERHGIVVTLMPFAGSDTKNVDAFSTSHLPRPIVVLTPDRADDVYRHRFTAAHELGHLILHADTAPGDLQQERKADAFAAELLTPAEIITPLLPKRMDLHALDRLSKEWGVAVESLIYRCREVGAVPEPTYRRAFQRLNQLRKLNLFGSEPVIGYPGEVPTLLSRAYELAEANGLTVGSRSRAEDQNAPPPVATERARGSTTAPADGVAGSICTYSRAAILGIPRFPESSGPITTRHGNRDSVRHHGEPCRYTRSWTSPSAGSCT